MTGIVSSNVEHSILCSVHPILNTKGNLRTCFGQCTQHGQGRPLPKALNAQGVSSIADLLTMTEQDITELVYDDKGTNTPVHKAHMNVIWNLHLIQTYGIRKVDLKDQQMVNEDKLVEFRVSGYDPNNPRLSQGSTTALPIPYPALPASISPARQWKSAAADFRKGNKRDKSHYRELKYEAHLDDWKRSTLATVAAHGCELIMDPVYKPTNQDELELLPKCRSLCMMSSSEHSILPWVNTLCAPMKPQGMLRLFGGTILLICAPLQGPIWS